MNEKFLKEIVVDQLKKEIPAFKVGDELSVSIRIQEGEKERLQKFVGIVIARKGSGISETFTVRRVTDGVGVERIFPLHSPNIANVKVTKASVVSDKARMYYMRRRSGKAANQVREERFYKKID